MTRAFKPYPAYRDSGLKWSSMLPKHWETHRLKTCVTNVVDITNEREFGDIYLALEHVESWTGKIVSMDLDTVFESQVKRFQPNDVLFGKLRPYLAKSTRLGRKGVCVGEFLVLRTCNDILSNYLEILLRSKSVVDAIDASTSGAKMPRADWRFIGNMSFPLPPFSEQAVIVRYIDHVSERIDFYINLKERLVTLLNEKKRAVIHQAIMGGLDSNAPMKPTDIDWMPKVPIHWKIQRLKSRVMDVVDMATRRRSNDIYIALEHVESWTGKIVNIDLETKFESQVKRFRPDDVLFGKLRPYLAKTTRPDREGVCVGEFLVLRSRDDNIAPSYLEFWLRSKPVIDAIDASTFGAKMPRADWRFIGSMSFPLPPFSEQIAISAYLQKAIGKIDATINRSRRQIDLLREYRERLIDDVVTGKLDVREAHADTESESGVVEWAEEAPPNRISTVAPPSLETRLPRDDPT